MHLGKLFLLLSIFLFVGCSSVKDSDWSELNRREYQIEKAEYESVFEGDPNFYFPIYKKRF